MAWQICPSIVWVGRVLVLGHAALGVRGGGGGGGLGALHFIRCFLGEVFVCPEGVRVMEQGEGP